MKFLKKIQNETEKVENKQIREDIRIDFYVPGNDSAFPGLSMIFNDLFRSRKNFMTLKTFHDFFRSLNTVLEV